MKYTFEIYVKFIKITGICIIWNRILPRPWQNELWQSNTGSIYLYTKPLTMHMFTITQLWKANVNQTNFAQLYGLEPDEVQSTISQLTEDMLQLFNCNDDVDSH